MLAADLERAAELFALPHVDRLPLRTAYETVCRDPALGGWVATAAQTLRDAMGEPAPGPVLDPRPGGGESGGGARDEAAAYLPVLAFAEVLPDLMAHHRKFGVSEQVTAATLVDVGRMLARNRAWFGEAGLGEELGRWPTRHLHGALFQLGRLQYERVRLGEGTALELRMAGFPCGPGDLALALHIPADGGGLTPERVDASLAEARRFFARHFADERYAALTCHSWMLDLQLRDVLAADSHLARFQARFTIGSEKPDEGDESFRKFVFGDLHTPVDRLPQDTALRRGVVWKWQRGGHWHVRRGWIAWP